MVIKNLKLVGLLGNEKEYMFVDGFNLVFSEENTRGKTTLLRFILYAFGYNIPSTKGIGNFDGFTVEIDVLASDGKDYVVKRHGGLVTVVGGAILDDETFILPRQADELQRLLFGISERRVLDNLLGVFYLDQEKGWTMLNRGKVIGSVRFNVEDYVAGLSGRDLRLIKERIKKLDNEIGRYRGLLSVIEFRDESLAAEDFISLDNPNDEVDKLIRRRNMLERMVVEDGHMIQDLKNIMEENDTLVKIIEKQKLAIRYDGKIIPVTADNIDGFMVNQVFVGRMLDRAKRMHSKHVEELARVKSILDEKSRSLGTKNLLEDAQKNVIEVNADRATVERIIQQLQRDRKEAQKLKKDELSLNNKVLNKMYEDVYKYAHELGISQFISRDSGDFLLTDTLKIYSGRVLAQFSFVFRLAYVRACERSFGIRLPIIVDSPRASEMTEQSTRAMLDILQRDFGDYQVILASVYDINDNFDDLNKITLRDGVMGTLPL